MNESIPSCYGYISITIKETIDLAGIQVKAGMNEGALEDSSAVLVDFNKVFIFSPISFCIMILIITCIYVAAGVKLVSFLLQCLRALDIYIGCWIYILMI